MIRKWIFVLIALGAMIVIQANHALELGNDGSVQSLTDAMGSNVEAKSRSQTVGSSADIQATSHGLHSDYNHFVEQLEKQQLSGYTYNTCFGLIEAVCQPIGSDLKPIHVTQQDTALLQKTDACIQAIANTCGMHFNISQTTEKQNCFSNCRTMRHQHLSDCETRYTRFSADWNQCKNQSIAKSQHCYQACANSQADQAPEPLTTDPMGVGIDPGQQPEAVKRLEKSPMPND